MTTANSSPGFRFPAEFERQGAVWLGWPTHDAKKGLSTTAVYLELIDVLRRYVTVRVATQDETERRAVAYYLKARAIPTENIELFCIRHDDIWFRDMGPIFLSDERGQQIVQGFEFNCWGYEHPGTRGIRLDQAVAQRVAEALDLEFRSSILISEGGDREFNGQGTLIMVEAVELQRNPEMSRDEIEAEFKRIFGLRHVIWLKKGVYDDDQAFDGTLPGPAGLRNVLPCLTTGGHVDEHCRFVSPDTVLVAEVSEEEAASNPIASVTRRRLEENVAILREAGDHGNSLTIHRIPVPDPLFAVMHPGDYVYDSYKAKYGQGFVCPLGDAINTVAATSYCNFLITNGAVIAPHYWRPGLADSMRRKDRTARATLEELFPDREVHTLDVRALNFGGGGIHCITQQQPAGS